MRKGRELEEKSEDTSENLLYICDRLELLVQNTRPLVTVNDLTPQIRFNILRKDYFISENIVINETALNTVY